MWAVDDSLSFPPSTPHKNTRAAFSALLAKFQGKPHCETKHGRPWEGPEDAGRKGEKGEKIQADGLSSLVRMEKSVSRMLSKPVNTLKPNESETCFRN